MKSARKIRSQMRDSKCKNGIDVDFARKTFTGNFGKLRQLRTKVHLKPFVVSKSSGTQAERSCFSREVRLKRHYSYLKWIVFEQILSIRVGNEILWSVCVSYASQRSEHGEVSVGQCGKGKVASPQVRKAVTLSRKKNHIWPAMLHSWQMAISAPCASMGELQSPVGSAWWKQSARHPEEPVSWFISET